MKTRRNKLIMKYAAYVGAIVLIVTVGVSFLSYRLYNSKLINERAKYEKQLEMEQAKLQQYEAKSRPGWILVNDKKAGETINETDVKSSMLPDYFTPENVTLTKEDVVGKVIKIDALQSTALTAEMIYEDGKLDPSERKEEVQYIRLPLKLQSGDTVDIRIVFPNGEDYIVVAKKKIHEVDIVNQNAFFHDTEEEALLLQAALVDAYINDAEIYMKQYVEPEMQPKPNITYTPNEDVLRIIKNNPQIVNKARWEVAADIRKALEERLDSLDISEKIRIGAGAPMGSAVAKRKKEDGAVYVPSQQPSNQAIEPNGTSVGVNGIVNQPTTSTPIYTPTDTSTTAPVPPSVDTSQSIKQKTESSNNVDSTPKTETSESSTVYPEPKVDDIPDVTDESNVPNLLGGE